VVIDERVARDASEEWPSQGDLCSSQFDVHMLVDEPGSVGAEFFFDGRRSHDEIDVET
jgi:hypothetical protein